MWSWHIRVHISTNYSEMNLPSLLVSKYTSGTVCPIGQYIVLACILLNAWSKINERPHDMALNWMLLDVSVLQKEKNMIIVSFVYTCICIAVGDPFINRGGLGSN
jgi:hypothetical protein